MIFVWGYLASILPAMLIAAFMFGRDGAGRLAVQGAVICGAAWPIMLPCFGIVAAIQWAVDAGEAVKKL